MHRGLLLLAIGAALIVAIVLWTAFSYHLLAQRIEGELRDAAAFYRQSVQQDVQPLLASGALLSKDETLYLEEMAHVDLTTGGRSAEDVLRSVQDAQLSHAALLAGMRDGDALGRSAAFGQLEKDIGKDGAVLPVLKAYNVEAQAWNNKHDELLGGLYARFLHLGLRQLLNPQGKKEFETTISF